VEEEEEEEQEVRQGFEVIFLHVHRLTCPLSNQSIFPSEEVEDPPVNSSIVTEKQSAADACTTVETWRSV
jgi:hypothetical protein